jgi:hypothetical protein
VRRRYLGGALKYNSRALWYGDNNRSNVAEAFLLEKCPIEDISNHALFMSSPNL